MNIIGNLIWLIFGGFFSALGYFVGGIILCLTVIGIPFGIQCFKIGFMVLMPFGSKVVSDSSSTGCLSIIFNIIWLLCGGFYTAIMHIVWGLLLTITIIGIPFGKQHFKLVELSLMPFGKRIVAE
ncbi:MAG: YccF domain-containing protein [Deinococcales bacterium]|nr:YccF domain-containing protein [Chitinophagaceae bacterium]